VAIERTRGGSLSTVGILGALVALSSGCAFEVQSVGQGNGGLEGDGIAPGVVDGGVETPSRRVELELPAPITAIETPEPDTGLAVVGPDTGLVAVGPGTGISTEVVIKEPDCTPATEKTDCPGSSCHPKMQTCTSLGVATRGTCETCFSDSNCEASDHRCVKMTYYGEPFPDELTGFCLQITVPVTVDGAYSCTPPLAIPLVNRVSISGGKNQAYCGLYEKLTSCPAVLAFQASETCPSGRDDECPEGGLCREFKASENKTEYRCTHACDGAVECSSDRTKVACAGFCGG